MKKVDSIGHALRYWQGKKVDFLPPDGERSWRGYQGVSTIHFLVGIEWEWNFREIKGLGGGILPQGGKRSTWQQVLCHTE